MTLIDWFLIALGILFGVSIGIANRDIRLRGIAGRVRRTPPPASNSDSHGDMTGKPVRPKRNPPSLRAAAEAVPEPEPTALVLRGHALPKGVSEG